MRFWPKRKEASPLPPPDPRHPIANMVEGMLAAGWSWDAIILHIRAVELATEQRTQALMEKVKEVIVDTMLDCKAVQDDVDTSADPMQYFMDTSEADERRRVKDA
jgi:hypothetical protein